MKMFNPPYFQGRGVSVTTVTFTIPRRSPQLQGDITKAEELHASNSSHNRLKCNSRPDRHQALSLQSPPVDVTHKRSNVQRNTNHVLRNIEIRSAALRWFGAV